MTSENQKPINFLVPSKIKSEFYTTCRKKSLNPSALMRNWVEAFLSDKVEITITPKKEEPKQ